MKWLKENAKVIGGVVLLLVFLAVGYFAYNKWYTGTQPSSQEVANQQVQSELTELRNELQRVQEEQFRLQAERQVWEPTPHNLNAILGESGSGFVSSEDLREPEAHVFSFSHQIQDDELGNIYLPNYREGRAFVVEKDGNLPNFVFHVDKPEGYYPVSHPSRTCSDGKHFIVFAKVNHLVN